jgi:glycosyltransferase involved in cell wall biosynthesis
LRILVVTGVFPPDIGGPASYVPEISAALSRAGHRVTVLTVSDDPRAEADSQLPFTVRRLRRRQSKLLRWPRTIAAVIELGRRADVLFVNGLALESAIANIVLRRPHVQKVVGDLAWEQATGRGWTGDDFEAFQTRRQSPRAELLKLLRGWWLRQSDRVIANCRYQASWVARWGVSADRVTTIYNASESVPAAAPQNIPLDAPIKLITTARLVSWKGIDGVVEAVAGVPQVGLAIVGDGPERDRLGELAERLGAGDRVWFAGRRRRDETIALMRSADIFVLNSTWESFPHAVVEAMGCGLPVIATRVGGTDEIVQEGENGMLVPPRDVAALRGAVAHLANSESSRRRLADAAHATSQQFTPDRMVAETLAVFQQVSQR